MAEGQSPLRAVTPSSIIPQRRPFEEDHAPAIPSPLNPDPSAARTRLTRPPARESREKKDSLKKRESNANTRGNTPDGSVRDRQQAVPSPMRYSVPEPKPTDYEPPKDPVFTSHEPNPFLTPDGKTELKKPTDHAENKKAYRYTHCVADPLFRHKQYYRQSDSKPYGPRMSFEDSDVRIHFDASGKIVTNEKGWRMSRGNVVAREGTYYFEVKIIRGVPAEGPVVPVGSETLPQPHIRMGWARREAPLDAPVGFDGYSYGVTDIRFETMHRSRSGKFFNPTSNKSKTKAASKAKASSEKTAEAEAPVDDNIREGDVVGLELTLPSLSLHRKVVSGDYNPAVDVNAGFDDPVTDVADVIRDRIPVPYKGNFYFEQLEYQTTKAMEQYGDRGPFNHVSPSPNHPDPALRCLPFSSIRVYKNGVLVGTAFEKLMAFLPPASQPLAAAGARPGFDDGMLGYFPAISAFSGGIAEVNFGPAFWFPPSPAVKAEEGTDMGASVSNDSILKVRAIGERYKEQIAEDIVYDLIDEASFFVEDGGYSYTGSLNGALASTSTHKSIASL